MTQKTAFIDPLIGNLSQLLGKGTFPLHEPNFDDLEEKNVFDCLQTGWVSSVGKYVDQFERDLAKYTGAKRAIVMMNGTAALHICYLMADVGPGDEVLCPSLTFAATANAIQYCGATPHFVDIEEKTLGVDPEKLGAYLAASTAQSNGQLINKATGLIIKALVVTHVFGHPARITELKKICDQFGIILIEDAAESLGSFYKGTHTGNFGKVAALSFNGNKIMTTGGGGAVLTNDEALGARIKYLTTTAKKPHAWDFEHTELGYNYRMPNVNAAIGCAQLSKINHFLEQKRKLFFDYQNVLQDIEGVDLMGEPENCRSNFWLNAIILRDRDRSILETVLEKAHRKKILLRPVWKPLHLLPYFKKAPRMNLAKTEEMADRILNLPSSVGLA